MLSTIPSDLDWNGASNLQIVFSWKRGEGCVLKTVPFLPRLVITQQGAAEQAPDPRIRHMGRFSCRRISVTSPITELEFAVSRHPISARLNTLTSLRSDS